MTTDAAIHLTSLVFKDEGPALVDMALQAGLLVVVGLVEHLRGLTHAKRGGETAMRIVAIAACHGALVHTVLKRQIELRAYVGMAPVAKFRLLFGEQILGCC